MKPPSTRCNRCAHRRDYHKDGTGKCSCKTYYEGMKGPDGRCLCPEFLEPDNPAGLRIRNNRALTVMFRKRHDPKEGRR